VLVHFMLYVSSSVALTSIDRHHCSIEQASEALLVIVAVPSQPLLVNASRTAAAEQVGSIPLLSMLR
jgi:hypothetical protein